MPDILLEKKAGIGSIILNRPKKLNCFSFEMIDDWIAALQELKSDEQINVIVLTGAGKNFCGGMDFSSAGTAMETDAYEMKCLLWDKVHRIPLILEDLDKPVIAAMKGVAIGAGLDMALMCDIRFASDTARFAEGYVNGGMIPGDGGAYYLPRLVGIAKALELLLSGDIIDANEALRIGLINRKYKESELLDETYSYAERIECGPASVHRMIKRMTYQSSRMDLKSALDMASSHMGVIRLSRDSKDAFQKAMEKFGKSR